MKRYQLMMMGALLCVGTAMVAMFQSGCEDTPSMTDLDRYFAQNGNIQDPRTTGSSPVSINPSSGRLTFQSQQLTFRAQGGQWPYSWGVANGNGTIARQTRSDTAIYTATALQPNSVIVSDALGRSAIAQLSVGSGQALSVSPASGSATNGVSIAFQASGGTTPYTFNLSSSTGGGISPAGQLPAGQSTTVYTAGGGNGIDILTLTDSSGNTVQATITVTN